MRYVKYYTFFQKEASVSPTLFRVAGKDIWVDRKACQFHVQFLTFHEESYQRKFKRFQAKIEKSQQIICLKSENITYTSSVPTPRHFKAMLMLTWNIF